MILLLFPRRELHTYPSSCRCLYAPTNAPVQAPRVGYDCGSVTQVSREPTRVRSAGSLFQALEVTPTGRHGQKKSKEPPYAAS